MKDHLSCFLKEWTISSKKAAGAPSVLQSTLGSTVLLIAKNMALVKA